MQKKYLKIQILNNLWNMVATSLWLRLKSNASNKYYTGWNLLRFQFSWPSY